MTILLVITHYFCALVLPAYIPLLVAFILTFFCLSPIQANCGDNMYLVLPTYTFLTDVRGVHISLGHGWGVFPAYRQGN